MFESALAKRPKRRGGGVRKPPPQERSSTPDERVCGFFNFSTLGVLCLPPFRFSVLGAPNSEPRGSHLVPLAPICGSCGLPFGSTWLPCGSVWLPFGSPLAFRWFPFGSLVALCCYLGVPSAYLWLLGGPSERKLTVSNSQLKSDCCCCCLLFVVCCCFVVRCLSIIVS